MEEEEEEEGVGADSLSKERLMEVAEAGGAAGLNAVLLLLMSRLGPAPGARLPALGSLAGPREPSTEAEGGEPPPPPEPPEPGSGSLAALAKSFQKAEALLRHCVTPSLWRLSPRGPGPGPRRQPGEDDDDDDDDDEEDWPAGLAHLAQVERTLAALSCCLCVQEHPRTETFQGYVRPPAAAAAAPEAAAGPPFSFHAARSCVARRCATLHALLQQRRHLRLARHFVRRLRAASDFVGRLGRREGPGRRLRELCEELPAHAAHWPRLRQHLRADPWLRPLLARRPEAVRHMKRALLLLALLAARLLEGCLEALLRRLARGGPAALPVPLADCARALELFNRAAGGPALQQAWAQMPPGSRRLAFPPQRVLGILTEERGRPAAQRLYLLLLGQPARAASPAVGPAPPWEGPEPSPSTTGSLSKELRSLCQEEEGALLCLLQELAASTHSLWPGALQRREQEKPPGATHGVCLPTWKSVRWLDASFAEVAAGLSAQYCPLLWRVAASTFAFRLELDPPLSPKASGAAMGQQLIHALAEGCVPRESAKELRALGHHLLLREVLSHWDQGFCHALGSSLHDKCMARPGTQDTGAACSQTGELLQGLYQPLSFALRCLDPPLAGSAGGHLLSASLRLKLLSLSVATSHASCYWVMSKAHQYLASWSLSPFLLVTQGDLQMLKTKTKNLWVQVGEAFPDEEGRKQHLFISVLEQDLRQQIHAMITSIHLFSDDVLSLFSLDCKRMSSEIFSQTMPLGKHWRLPLRTELPASPSDYASAAVQTVLGQVLQGIQLLPREAQGLALSHVTTAFVEAWMDHIVAQKIKFSLHGALQLKQDFDLVKALLQSEDYGLSPEIKQLVLSLQVFQQMDSAIACLLQQPCKASLPSHTWGAFHHCCSYHGIQTLEEGPGNLNSLESLEAPPAQGVAVAAAAERPLGDLLSHLPGPGGCSPDTYLSPTHQEWLALRLHGGRRWRVPTLSCMSRTSEP